MNYKFQELSRMSLRCAVRVMVGGGVPRFPSFGGERVDVSEAKDAVIPGIAGGDD